MQGTCSWYWSSSPVEDRDGYAWLVNFYYGVVGHGYVADNGVDEHVRCVR